METVLKDGVYWLKEPQVSDLDEWAYKNGSPVMLVETDGYDVNEGKVYAYADDVDGVNDRMLLAKNSISDVRLYIFRSCIIGESVWSVEK